MSQANSIDDLGKSMFGRPTRLRVMLGIRHWDRTSDNPAFFLKQVADSTKTAASAARDEIQRLVQLGMVTNLPDDKKASRRVLYAATSSPLWQIIDQVEELLPPSELIAAREM